MPAELKNRKNVGSPVDWPGYEIFPTWLLMKGAAKYSLFLLATSGT